MNETTYTAAQPKIGAAEVRQAMQILKKYKQGKKQLEQRLLANERFWRLCHWQEMEAAGQGGNSGDIRPTSAWLVNCILTKHADAMDCYPEPTVLPREPGDAEEAAKLKDILPVILRRSRFRKVYADAWWRKLKSGCAVYGVFWDSRRDGGLGDIDIRSMDLLQLYWQPGITDIQDSPHFFSTELADNETLLRQYPQLEGRLGRGSFAPRGYLYDESVDVSDKSVVVDWYYHTENEGRKVLQYCKFVGENVLFATENENDDELAARGWYDHGRYPFVFDPLFPEEGTPCGYGYVDLCKSPQQQIDLMNQAILKNALAGATPRFFIRSDGAVNEAEYADWTQPFVHTNGNLGADSIAPIQSARLDGVYVAYLQNKIDEMKETAGNRDLNSGGVTGGVTAATAIAALQEAGGKLSRNMIADSYDCFADVITLVIELVRQFYSLPRQFRLLGGQFVSYDSAGLQGRTVRDGLGQHYQVPEFDLEIAAQKETPYQTMEHNQLALQLYQLGFFQPEKTEEALCCLEMMEFKNKSQVMEIIGGGSEVERYEEMLVSIYGAMEELAKGHLDSTGEAVVAAMKELCGEAVQRILDKETAREAVMGR